MTTGQIETDRITALKAVMTVRNTYLVAASDAASSLTKGTWSRARKDMRTAYGKAEAEAAAILAATAGIEPSEDRTEAGYARAIEIQAKAMTDALELLEAMTWQDWHEVGRSTATMIERSRLAAADALHAPFVVPTGTYS